MSQSLPLSDILPKIPLQMNSSNLPSVSNGGAVAQLSPAARNLLAVYRNEDTFLSYFNPGRQVVLTKDLVNTFRGNAPSLGLVATTFGDDARDNWLDIQITELAAFSGCKDKLTDHQIQSLIDIVAEEYHYLKVTEIMYFFRKFKAGEYGKFYGAVDPLTITCALKEFCDDRRAILSRLHKEENDRRRRNDPEYIRWLRQYSAYERMASFYSVNFRSKDFTLDDFREVWWLFNLGYERKNHGYIEP